MAETQETRGQKITTYYAEAQKRKEGIAHHNEQAEKMRKLRSQQESPLSKVKRVARKAGEKAKDIASSPAANRIKTFAKDRSAAVAPLLSRLGDAAASGSGSGTEGRVHQCFQGSDEPSG